MLAPLELWFIGAKPVMGTLTASVSVFRWRGASVWDPAVAGCSVGRAGAHAPIAITAISSMQSGPHRAVKTPRTALSSMRIQMCAA
jgi:hypothetical protein